jgi:3-methyladenine DNA glycosylase Mpg
MSRIYGKPEAAVVAHVAPNPAADVIRAMSLEEKLELLHSLRRGKSDEPAVLEGSATTSNELEQ